MDPWIQVEVIIHPHPSPTPQLSPTAPAGDGIFYDPFALLIDSLTTCILLYSLVLLFVFPFFVLHLRAQAPPPSYLAIRLPAKPTPVPPPFIRSPLFICIASRSSHRDPPGSLMLPNTPRRSNIHTPPAPTFPWRGPLSFTDGPRPKSNECNHSTPS